jgi:cobalt/nickel transport system permease protein
LGTGLELALSGTSPANIAIPAMGGIHAIIGIGEGLITLGALAFIYATRPDLLGAGQKQVAGGKTLWVVGLLIAVALAIASPLASSHPDGLEWVAQQKGFLDTARGPLFQIIPDYVLPGVSNEALATILAGILGTLIVFGMALAVAYTRRNRSTPNQ